MAFTIEKALADFEWYYKLRNRPSIVNQEILYVLIGSERRFCWDFNERLLEYLENTVAGKLSYIRILIVGRKLESSLEGDSRLVGSINGASAAEEVPRVISELANHLVKLSDLTLAIVHHQNRNEASRTELAVAYPFDIKEQPIDQRFKFPPIPNYKPEELYPQFLE